MQGTSPRIRSLLRQAKRTTEAGKRAAAHQLYTDILSEAPETVEAWLGLARVAPDEEAREAAYRQVLELDPDNATALAQLEQVDGAATRTKRAATEAEAELAGSTQDLLQETGRWLEEATRRLTSDGDVLERARKPAPVREEARKQPQPSSGPQPLPAPVLPPVPEPQESDEVLYCYRHPNRETGLRCYSCNRPICISCAQHTPVGYRCPQCIRQAQDVFFSANAIDYVLAGIVALILGLIAGFIAPRLGFFVIFIGPAAGTLIGRLAFRAARRRHGRYLAHTVGAMVALGGFIPAGLPILLTVLLAPASIASFGLMALLWPAIYVFMATGAAYYQVR